MAHTNYPGVGDKLRITIGEHWSDYLCTGPSMLWTGGNADVMQNYPSEPSSYRLPDFQARLAQRGLTDAP